MVVIDTNELSALMRELPDRAVAAWLDGQSPESVWTTSITLFEVRFGLARMAPGRRRSGLGPFEALIRDDLEGRVLGIDSEAAEQAAGLAAMREAAGRPVELRDTLLAGIALVRGCAIATRNVWHFADLVDLDRREGAASA